jgi:hypothetical protein
MATDVNALVKCIPYIKSFEEYGYSYKPLKPTGRWMIQSGPYFTMKMFIEHKGWLFKRMISEDRIVFKPEQAVSVFDCT